MNFMKTFALIFLFACLGCTRENPQQPERVPKARIPQRLISLAPSVTEVLFSLGLGDKVQGVTQYCNYPESARLKPRIGGYFNPSYEAILARKPDLVICLNEHEKEVAELEKLGLSVLVLDHRSVNGILQSISEVGIRCGAHQQAEDLVASLTARLNAIKAGTAGLPKPGVLVSIGRNMGTATLKDVHVAGPPTIYNELIEYAGGVNVVQEKRRAYPIFSAEGMMQLNPQVILDMVTEVDESKVASLMAEWQVLGDRVKAVSDDRVHILTGDHVTVPGPRFILLLEDMVKAIHPQAMGEFN